MPDSTKTRLSPSPFHCAILLTVHLVTAQASGKDTATPDFNSEIRPILSENCFHCHGPDPETRKGGLRLDTFDGATEDIDGTKAIVPGDLAKSELHYRLITDDEDDVMPPRKSKRSLTPKQIDLLSRWIESGAQYDQHWAFAPPTKITPETTAKSTHPIDHFVDARLKEAGISPSPPATPEKLARRLHLDLIGLPPSPAEIASFVEHFGTDPQAAVETTADHLLASPRFGEKWARPWLDLARYADSNGFQADQLRPSWAYRDWVIRAINDNIGFDQFTIEQLAGDLLPDSTTAQRIATGFHRTVTCNVEAGVHREENRVNQVVDRVNTTATVWLGLTLECAQCHDHKYDPLTQEDYFSMFAFFNNTPYEVSEPTSVKDVSHDFVGPFMDLPLGPEDRATQQRLTRELAAAKKSHKALEKADGTGFENWLAEARLAAKTPPEWQPLHPDSVKTNGGEDQEILADSSILFSGRLPDTVTHEATFSTDLDGIQALRVEVLTHESIPGKGPGRGDAKRSNIILSEFIAEQLVDGKTRSLDFTDAIADFSQTGWAVAKSIDGDPKTGWAIGPQFAMDHWAAYSLAKPLGHPGKSSQFRVELDQQYGRGRVLGRFRISALCSDPSLLSFPKPILAALGKDKPSKAQTVALKKHYNSNKPELRQADQLIAKLEKDLAAVTPDKTLVMVEMDTPRTTNVMLRGNYLSPAQEVSAATPAVLPPIDPALPKNRLGLARWLVSADNPLTARVAANRWWAEIFGQGIVSTPEDFGSQSELPTHPRLLDWLATELVESGWDRKHLIRQIVTSKTYQQDSRHSKELFEADPENKLLARAPRFRLSAEAIRDNALTIAGLRSDKMFGEPIMPHQPPNIWRQVGRNEPKWVEQKDENRWRRAIYIVYRRAAPYPSMVNFDAPDRGACTVKRPRTNTPLQALTLLNDPVYVELALGLADRVLTDSPDKTNSSRLAHAVRLATGRDIRPTEQKILSAELRAKTKTLRADPDLAKSIIKGASTYLKPKHKNTVELAVWHHLATILLNLDEVVTKE